MASSAANPNCPVTLFTPGEHDHHNTPHPMVSLPSGLSQPFSLLINPNNAIYEMTFNDHVNDPRFVRIFAMIYSSDTSNPTFTSSFRLPQGGPINSGSFAFSSSESQGAANLWVGAWWDDGTYGTGTRQNVIDYFSAHPFNEVHHTVPIIIT